MLLKLKGKIPLAFPYNIPSLRITYFRRQSGPHQESNVLEHVQGQEKTLPDSSNDQLVDLIELDDITREAVEMLPLNSFKHSTGTPDIPVAPNATDRAKYTGKMKGRNLSSIIFNTSKNNNDNTENIINEKSGVKLDEETKQVGT